MPGSWQPCPRIISLVKQICRQSASCHPVSHASELPFSLLQPLVIRMQHLVVGLFGLTALFQEDFLQNFPKVVRTLHHLEATD